MLVDGMLHLCGFCKTSTSSLEFEDLYALFVKPNNKKYIVYIETFVTIVCVKELFVCCAGGIISMFLTTMREW